jgi:hypothetical protein
VLRSRLRTSISDCGRMSIYEAIQGLLSPEQRTAQQRVVDALKENPTCLDKVRPATKEELEKCNG